MQSKIFQAFVIILMIMAYSLWKPQIKNLRKFEYYMKPIKKRF